MTDTAERPEPDTEGAPLTLADRVGALEAHQITLRREMRSLALEWEDIYEKMRTVVARLTRRDQRAAKAPEPNGKEGPVNPAALALLNPQRRADK